MRALPRSQGRSDLDGGTIHSLQHSPACVASETSREPILKKCLRREPASRRSCGCTCEATPARWETRFAPCGVGCARHAARSQAHLRHPGCRAAPRDGRLDLAPRQSAIQPGHRQRVWHWHFGQGLVVLQVILVQPEPAPAKLLDWLAGWFRYNGYQLKALHRLIVTSETYRQSTRASATALRVDRDNRLLWR